MLLSPELFAGIASYRYWKPASHHILINRMLMDLTAGEISRLIVNMPPRHGKSELISKYFPAWHLIKYPEKRIIFCTYAAAFSKLWGRHVRDLINEFGGEFEITLNKSDKSSSSLSIKGYQGGMIAVGAGGPITGRGADLLIIDDPVKNASEANSPTIRENTWEWFRSTAYTRIEPGGKVVLLMTRWHKDDLTGRIAGNLNTIPAFPRNIISGKSNTDDLWHMLTLPAIAEHKDMLGRKPGMPLWPQRISIEKLLEIKKTLGSYWFSALYQQQPISSEGAVFKKQHFRYFETFGDTYTFGNGRVLAKNCKIYASSDLAISTKSGADYTVFIIFSVTPDKQILINEIIRYRIDPASHLNLIKEIYENYKPVLIGIESVQYQASLVKMAMQKGYPIKELRPDTDKLTRSLPAAARIEAGQIYFRKNAPWLDEFEKELLEFPTSKHDDQVDALAYAVRMISPSNNTPVIGMKGEKKRGNQH